MLILELKFRKTATSGREKLLINNAMIHKLTKEQSTIIVSMWKKNDFEFLYDIGSQIYNRIFLLSPRTKQLFPYVVQAEARGENACNTAGFRTQVLRFVQALSTVIVSMQSTDLSELTQDAGTGAWSA
uniref:Globin family profile domain-containing protein n=1 Tax=Romanomermis culicivorax TaxID=13658 RepID=A0A915KVY2_ROMCU